MLTVREGQPNSHKGKGWELLTDAIIRKLNERNKPIAFILWGGNARAKAALITNPAHGVFRQLIRRLFQPITDFSAAVIFQLLTTTLQRAELNRLTGNSENYAGKFGVFKVIWTVF